MAKIVVIGAIILVIVGAVCIYLIKNPTIANRNEYSWQKTCDSQCAEKVGKKDMAAIDAFGCTDLNMTVALDQEHQAAINDKFASINCTKPTPVDPAKAAQDYMKKYAQ